MTYLVDPWTSRDASPVTVFEQLGYALVGFAVGIPIGHLLGAPTLPLGLSAVALLAGVGMLVVTRSRTAHAAPPHLGTTRGRAVGRDGESSAAWQLSTEHYPGGLALIRVESRSAGATVAGWPTVEVVVRVDAPTPYLTRQAIGVERGDDDLLTPGSIHIVGRVDPASPDVLLVPNPPEEFADRARRGLSPAALATSFVWQRRRGDARIARVVLGVGTILLTAATTALLAIGTRPLVEFPGAS